MNKRIRRRLPGGGYLHIDRQLPFLVVYRRSGRDDDTATQRLLTGESYYVITDGRRRG